MSQKKLSRNACNLKTAAQDANPKAASSIDEFCQRWGVSRTKAYDLIKNGHLIAHHIGVRTVIFAESEEAWRASLPKLTLKANRSGGLT